MKFVYGAAVLLAIALCVWLFLNEEAAEPGDLSVFHEEIDQCNFCHIPWRGVSDRMCLQCHEFGEVSLLRREIRFHEEERHCLQCHVEHRGLRGNIAKMDHTILSGKIQCTQCHTDIHNGLFGSGCRECHGIRTWDVPGFRHPPVDRKNCSRCHTVPHSHRDRAFWEKIERSYGETSEVIAPEDCWRCHTIRDWRIRIMKYPIGKVPNRES